MAAILYVVADAAVPTAYEAALKTLLEDGGANTVTYISDETAEADLSAIDLVAVSGSVAVATIGTKYRNPAGTGVMCLDFLVADDAYGWYNGSQATNSNDAIDILLGATGHPVANGMTGSNNLLLSGGNQTFNTTTTSNVAGGTIIANIQGSGSRRQCIAWDTGEALALGVNAASRRVAMGLGGGPINNLSANGQSYVLNAAEWAGEFGAWGAGGTTLTPAVGSLTLTGLAPTVSATADLTLAPASGSLSLTGFAPTITVGGPVTVSPAAGTLTATGNAPTISATADITLAPAAGSLTLTGHAPTVTADASVTLTPATGSLTLTGHAPTVGATADVSLSPAAGTLTLTGHAPSLVTPVTVAPATGSLTITGLAPVASVGQDKRAQPAAGSLTLTGHAPAVVKTDDVWLATGVGALVLTGHGPTVTATADITVTPAAGSLLLTGYLPFVATTNPPAIVGHTSVTVSAPRHSATVVSNANVGAATTVRTSVTASTS